MWTKAFWLDTLERAIRTGAQVGVPVVTTAVGAGALDKIDWQTSAFIIVGAVVLSLLTSIGGAFRGSPTNASLVNTGGDNA